MRPSTDKASSRHQPRLWHDLREKPFRRHAGLARALALVLLLPCSARPAHAQGAVRSVHGDWQIRCDTPPGAQGEQCALIQSVVAEDRSNAGLTVIMLKTADQKSRLMRVVAPLGVLLPSGLGLKLDNQDVGRAGFVRCLPNGCVAEVVMDDKLLGQLKTAKTATFIIFETPEEGIGFPLSLNGLGEGWTSCREDGLILLRHNRHSASRPEEASRSEASQRMRPEWPLRPHGSKRRGAVTRARVRATRLAPPHHEDLHSRG